MGRRRKRGGMAGLGNAMTHHDRRHRKDNLITASGFGRRKRGQHGGLAGAMSLGDKMFGRKGKRGGIVAQVGQSLRERLTPSERAEIANEADVEYQRESDQYLDADKRASEWDQFARRDSRILNLLRSIRDRFRR